MDDVLAFAQSRVDSPEILGDRLKAVAKVDGLRLSWVDREEPKRIGAKLYGRSNG